MLLFSVGTSRADTSAPGTTQQERTIREAARDERAFFDTCTGCRSAPPPESGPRGMLAERAARSKHLYAIIDGALEEHVLEYLAKWRPHLVQARSLFDGTALERQTEAAPYLVEFVSSSPYADDLFGSARRLTLVFSASAHFEEVFAHLRDQLSVELPDHRIVNFRFYAPRVLMTYLEHSTAAETARFLGPIEEVLVWQADKQQWFVRHQAPRVASAVVSADQMKAFSTLSLDSFRERCAAHVAKFFAKQYAALGSTGMLALIDETISRGRGFGITAERDVMKLVDLVVVFGPRFADGPEGTEVRAILSDTRSPSGGRVDRAREWLTAHAAGAATVPRPSAAP
jgi:hypothetical protein